jgi:hypothetical protein
VGYLQFSLPNLDVRGRLNRRKPTTQFIRSKTETAIFNSLLCNVLCQNICVVIQSMYELSIGPSFWAESPLAQKGAEK